MAFDFIQSALKERQQQQLSRQRHALSCGVGRFVKYQGKQLINFSSNDYLGLATHPEVIQSANQALADFGLGSGGSPLVTGFTDSHKQLEQYLCQWLGFERCLLFGSGFGANNAVIQCLANDKDTLLIQDKLNHASLIEAGANVKANSRRFLHNDMNSLSAKLKLKATNKMVITEGVFSMNGDQAPLKQVLDLSRANDAWLMVDDAHGLGVLGEQGKGALAQAGICSSDIDIHMATFGKAVGTTGAFVGAKRDVVEYLIQHCRHYIYSTAMPAAMAAASLTSLKLMAKEGFRRDKLQQLIGHFRHSAKRIGVTLLDSQTAIQPIIIGDAEQAMSMSKRLKTKGIWLNAIRPPTVAPGSSRLRVTLSYHHELEDIDQLFNSIESLI